jgi:hypothetical protein
MTYYLHKIYFSWQNQTFSDGNYNKKKPSRLCMSVGNAALLARAVITILTRRREGEGLGREGLKA